MRSSVHSPPPLAERYGDAVLAAARLEALLPLWLWLMLVRLGASSLSGPWAAALETTLWLVGAPVTAAWVAAGLAVGRGRLRERAALVRRRLACIFAAALFILAHGALLLAVAFAGVLFRRLPGAGQALFWIWCSSGGLLLVWLAWRWLFPGLVALPLCLVGGVLEPGPPAPLVARAYTLVRRQPATTLAQVAAALLATAAASLVFAGFLAAIAATLLALAEAGAGITPELPAGIDRAISLWRWLVLPPPEPTTALALGLSSSGEGCWRLAAPAVRDAMGAYLLGALWSSLGAAYLSLRTREEAGEPSSTRDRQPPLKPELNREQEA